MPKTAFCLFFLLTFQFGFSDEHGHQHSPGQVYGGGHEREHSKKKKSKRRHKKSHVHGHGKMNVAIDGNRVFVEIEMPAHDVIGFEHYPSNVKDRQKLGEAVNTLSQEASIFDFPTVANCQMDNAEVKSELLEEESKTGHKHQNESHAEFKAEYKFSCKDIKKLKQIRFVLFKKLSGLKKLKTQVLSKDQQFSETLTPKSHVITLEK